jgi:uncharacterized protein
MRLRGTFVAASIIVASPAAADDGLSLYQAMEIVTGTDMRERPRGFAMCLEDVLVKVSGDPRLRLDPRVAEMKRHAADYVTTFNYVDPIAGTRPKDDQGTYDRSENLTVGFDPVKIDALLASLGEQPWHGPRPVLIPVLSVHGRMPPSYSLTANESRAAEQRSAFERVATEAGVAIKFPTPSELPKLSGSASCVPDGTIVISGELDWSETALGWVGNWRTCWNRAEHHWTISGVGYDQAFENLVEGAVLLASGRGSPER